ncbi:MAG: hypothetical protein ACRDQZ_03380 [Mycobacteriales bacterium]
MSTEDRFCVAGAAALATGFLLASAATASHSLPLRHGRYVADDCAGAPSSTSSWFGGGYVLQSPHAHCDAVSVARLSPNRFRIVARCFETSDGRHRFHLIDRIHLIKHREYELENRFGGTHARRCPG